jgi:hypothetical protein
MLLEAPVDPVEAPPTARLTLVVDVIIVRCLYCDEELEISEDVWCPGCEEPEEPLPAP